MTSLTRYPSGRITASFIDRKLRERPLKKNSPLTESQSFDVKQMHLHGIAAAIANKKSSLFFGLSIVSNSRILETHRFQGLKGITSHGRKTVREGTYLLEKLYGRNRLSFLTLTLPEAIDEPNRNQWAVINQRFFEEIVRLLRRRGLPEDYVAVTEIQLNRYKRTGRPAKHIHCVFVGRHSYSSWEISPKEITDLWARIVTNVMKPKDCNVKWNASVNIQMVKKSASAYMAKYLTKGQSDITKMSEAGHKDVIPKRWYGCSLALRSRIKSETRKIFGAPALECLEILKDSIEKTLWFYRDVPVDMGSGFPTIVGGFGQLKEYGAAIVDLFLSSQEFDGVCYPGSNEFTYVNSE